MNLHDFSCSLALVERSGIFCGKLKFRRVWGGECNSGTIEAVGGGGCKKENFDRVVEVVATVGQLRLFREMGAKG